VLSLFIILASILSKSKLDYLKDFLQDKLGWTDQEVRYGGVMKCDGTSRTDSVTEMVIKFFYMNITTTTTANATSYSKYEVTYIN